MKCAESAFRVFKIEVGSHRSAFCFPCPSRRRPSWPWASSPSCSWQPPGPATTTSTTTATRGTPSSTASTTHTRVTRSTPPRPATATW
ncbi:Coiled-coil and C2 domain-containing protein 1-like [Frankliniella fusca]|uniref:Coiled-coil and C2 domain-containing protein 1-like n=1 Tax=Frankliniella fusca TaxID=407009 RepID=A0AAE1H792_9NEOP|nr:Coiled-coil and C2 domain-containing protein 1-like [Frankliniella fusca]